MGYKSMEAAVLDLERNGHLLRIKTQVDPNLEIAEIHRRIYDSGGPALLFENVKGSPFRAVSNIYGTFERTDFLFRKTIKKVQKIVELKADPERFFKRPFHYATAPFTALTALPRKRWGKTPIEYGQTTVDQLPLVKSWPMDGGAFVTLPQVLSYPPGQPQAMKTNIGMYRVQLTGNKYTTNKEVGMHYQLHRGIGVHHKAYNESDEPFRVSIIVGGPPSHAFCAIMPLPEDLSEMTFAGMLGGRRYNYVNRDGYLLSGDADFIITGTIRKGEKMPEGPFGDHLGYYSLEHDFPVVDVDKVYHRKNAIWHFTVVGRPPAEDSSFGYLIHKIVEPLTAGEFPGIREVNAVDAAGVHPLLLAVGSERYMPFREPRPEEILTQANHLLGKGQTSLAKYLIIAAHETHTPVNCHDIPFFFKHVLERIQWERDLHFQTKTTMDTLDYSGTGWNAGSKVVMACAGEKVRELSTVIPSTLKLPDHFTEVKVVLPGILAISGPAYQHDSSTRDAETLAGALKGQPLDGFPMIVLVDNAEFTAANLNNFVWVTFTRSNPSHDIYGVDAFFEQKHWGCRGSLIIDARRKPHHAPELVEDPAVTKKVDQLFAKSGELYNYR